MVKRICLKCNAVFDRKFNYERHINKVFDCSTNKNETNDIDNLNENKLKKNDICENLQEFVKISKKFAGICENQQFNEINTEGNKNFNNEYPCSYCNKTYSSKYTLERHINESCKVKKANDIEKENIFKLLLEKDKENKDKISQLEEQNKLLMDKIDKLINIKETKSKKSTKSSKITNNNQQITNTSNILNNNQNITNNTQNNNNNIVMVNFGKEDLSIIDERQFIDKVIKKPNISGVKIPDEVLKIIHFNPQYPQLSNIYISDINREKCMVYEDGEWKLSNVNNIPQIMDKVCVFSAEQISNLRTKQPNNKPLNDRLDVKEKYNNMIDGDYVDDLRDEGRQVEIARCEEFQSHAYNTLKKTLYNEGKKLKKTMKIK
jgi:uncharacterized C2H2 Zn-finger protein